MREHREQKTDASAGGWGPRGRSAGFMRPGSGPQGPGNRAGELTRASVSRGIAQHLFQYCPLKETN